MDKDNYSGMKGILVTKNLPVIYTLFVFTSDISNSLPSLSFFYASEDIKKVFKDEIFCQRFPRGERFFIFLNIWDFLVFVLRISNSHENIKFSAGGSCMFYHEDLRKLW